MTLAPALLDGDGWWSAASVPSPRDPTAPSGGPRTDASDGAVVLEGDVVRITFENPETGFRVLRVAVPRSKDPATVVGVMPNVAPGTHIRATGRFEKNTKHGEQFRAQTVLSVAPETLDGLMKYLGSGIIPGVGPAFAKRIVDAFGEQTLKVLDREPERIKRIPGVGPRRAEAIRDAWISHRAVSAIMIFLQTHGASPALAARIFKRFGVKAVEIVSRSPYRLALDVWGIGFKTADRIAQSIGVDPRAPERAQAGVLQMLHDLTSRGHVYCPLEELLNLTAEMLALEADHIREAVEALVQQDRAIIDRDPQQQVVVYLKDLYDAEVELARGLLRLSTEPALEQTRLALEQKWERIASDFEKQSGIALAPAQRDAIARCSMNKVAVLTGGPGVGKTTIVKAILAVFSNALPSVRLAAPTGRAAKRMSEATGREATTLHRLLEYDPRTRTFARNQDRPIECDAIIVDEASMIDLPLALALLQALSSTSRLVLVGDVDQLPSVGPGAILRDVIESGAIATARLTEIFRQSEGSLIVENAHRIRAGERPSSAAEPSGEFFWIERTSGEDAAETIHELVTHRIPKRFALSSSRDIQVLTPMHQGPAGTLALNARLQEALNPNGTTIERGAKKLRTGDKVMQLRNDYDREVFNGDVGFISSIDIEERKLNVDFDGRSVAYEDADLDELTLAYAMTIHKSQGSEYPAVVIPLLTSHFVMLSRNLLYTAVTRGKQLVVLVADPRALGLALTETRKEERRTLLCTRLQPSG